MCPAGALDLPGAKCGRSWRIGGNVAAEHMTDHKPSDEARLPRKSGFCATVLLRPGTWRAGQVARQVRGWVSG